MKKYSWLLGSGLLLGLLAIVVVLSDCGGPEPKAPQESQTPKPKKVSIPAFNADSAYALIEKQVSFGPRVLGSEGHDQAKEWLINQFEELGWKVIRQDFTAEVYTGEKFPATNIIAQMNPEATDRILLAAHWDTRHVADSPLSTERQDEPILGADDAGSGVAVLLEIARQLTATPISTGIDIVLFDAEDYGQSGAGAPDSYALGSQFWARNVHTPYKPRFGILLDMVGAEGAQFKIEGYSYLYAREYVDKIWTLAKRMGKNNYFVFEEGGGVTDDHYYVNTIAQIPMLDIINLAGSDATAFGAHWHTHQDNLDIIDKNTLRAVGQVVLAVLYRDEAGLL
ncbi:MAG: M28 family peptidase [Bacteroidetes bacterium]|nr:MAG: M28 family peptidase [Bacteroidota bacterium]